MTKGTKGTKAAKPEPEAAPRKPGRTGVWTARKLIKMAPADLAAWTAAAGRMKVGLNGWIRDICNSAVAGIREFDRIAKPAGKVPARKPARKSRGGRK